MAREQINYNKIHSLTGTSILPRSFQSSTFGSPEYVPEDHNPVITALLGKDRIIWYEYPTPDRRQIVWAYTDPDPKHKQDKAVGLYYDTQGVLTRIVIKSGQGFSRRIASAEREPGVLMVDIDPYNGRISGENDDTIWHAWQIHEDGGKKRFGFEAKLQNKGAINSLSEANSVQMGMLKRAGFHPKLFYAAQKLLDQQRTITTHNAIYGLLNVLVANAIMEGDIHILEQALAGVIDKPPLIGVLAVMGVAFLCLNNSFVALTGQLNSVSRELNVALASKDPKFIIEALSHGVTASGEELIDNATIVKEVAVWHRQVNREALKSHWLTPLGFKSRLAKITPH